MGIDTRMIDRRAVAVHFAIYRGQPQTLFENKMFSRLTLLSTGLDVRECADDPSQPPPFSRAIGPLNLDPQQWIGMYETRAAGPAIEGKIEQRIYFRSALCTLLVLKSPELGLAKAGGMQGACSECKHAWNVTVGPRWERKEPPEGDPLWTATFSDLAPTSPSKRRKLVQRLADLNT